MCLVTPDKTLYIAEKDLVCYKSMNPIDGKPNRVNSNIQWFSYEIGKLYKTSLRKDSDYCTYDSDASVALDNAGYTDSHREWRQNKEITSIGQGFHSSKTKKRIQEHGGVVYRCIIPKGSKYMKDLSGLLVSNQIIIQRRVR